MTISTTRRCKGTREVPGFLPPIFPVPTAPSVLSRSAVFADAPSPRPLSGEVQTGSQVRAQLHGLQRRPPGSPPAGPPVRPLEPRGPRPLSPSSRFSFPPAEGARGNLVAAPGAVIPRTWWHLLTGQRQDSLLLVSISAMPWARSADPSERRGPFLLGTPDYYAEL